MISFDDYFGLGGKVALVVGGTGGIGTETGLALAAAGASVAICSDDAVACDTLARRVVERGGVAMALAADVTAAGALDRVVDRVLERFGGIDVLVCNAGISGAMGSMADMPDDDRARLFAVNLDYAIRLTGRVARLMADRGGGSIVLMSSIAGLRGNRSLGLYGLTKAALAQLARNLAVEWGPRGVRANAIAPGLIRTSWADAILSSPERTAQRMGQTPLRRVGEPREIAAAALFLAGPGAGFITGQTLVADGGTLISDGS